MRVRTASLDEREALEALMRRASIALPTYRDAILQHPDAISVPVELLRTERVRVAADDGLRSSTAYLSNRPGGVGPSFTWAKR